MSLNCAEINLILGELDLQGSFIQKIIQSSYDTLTFIIYKNGKTTPLFFCFAPNFVRLHALSKIPPKNETPLRFQDFLRSRFTGARINSAKQIGDERIVQFNVSKANENGDIQDFYFFARLWTNAANLIVTDANFRILDAFYRKPHKNEIPCGTFSLDFLSEKRQNDGRKFVARDFQKLLRDENLLREGETLSFNRAAEMWYFECAGKLSRVSLLEQAEREFSERKFRIEKAISALENKKREFLRADELREKGDLILSQILRVEQAIASRQNEIECDGFVSPRKVKIKLDLTKSASENANEYFKSYKKAVSGVSGIERDIRILKSDLEKIEKDFSELQKEENPILIQKKMRKNAASKTAQNDLPGLRYDIGGWTILIGRTAAENDELLRRHVRGSDWWLHVRDFSGGYVFIKSQKQKEIPHEILIDAANLAVFYSKARKNAAADLYFTQVKYLRRAKGAPKGTVLPTNEKNLFVKLDENRLARIEDAAKGVK